MSISGWTDEDVTWHGLRMDYHSGMKRRELCKDMDESKDVMLSKISRQKQTGWSPLYVESDKKKKVNQTQRNRGWNSGYQGWECKWRCSTVNQSIHIPLQDEQALGI